jgi:hypothetical protein
MAGQARPTHQASLRTSIPGSQALAAISKTGHRDEVAPILESCSKGVWRIIR